MKKEFQIETQWTAFPLHPETPDEGLTLEELFTGHNVDIPMMMTRLKEVAEQEGLPIGVRNKTFNSRLAQELGKWAETEHQGEKFHNAAFRSYFVDGENIAKISVLVDLAKSIGLDEKRALTILETREFKKVVDQDWLRSYEMGITAVPTFVINHQALVGAQSYDALKQFLKSNDVKERK